MIFCQVLSNLDKLIYSVNLIILQIFKSELLFLDNKYYNK